MTYKVPADRTAQRVAVWRKIKSLGAVYLQNGVCLLPKSDDHLRRLKLLENDITGMGGEAILLEAVSLDEAQQGKVVSRFNSERDQAYSEFLERCEGFEDEISRESAAGKFTYAELEENDEDLKKLRAWLAKIQVLDFCGASLAQTCVKKLKTCEARLEQFTKDVFDAQDENTPDDDVEPR